MTELATIFIEAAAYIDKHGWWRRGMESIDSKSDPGSYRACIANAITWTIGSKFPGFDLDDIAQQNELHTAAVQRLEGHFEMDVSSLFVVNDNKPFDEGHEWATSNLRAIADKLSQQGE